MNELTARGMVGVASYRIAPKEDLRDAARAKPGSSASRLKARRRAPACGRGRRQDLHACDVEELWTTSLYWGYYNYGWGATYTSASTSRTTVVVVESLVFNVQKDVLLWGAVTQTNDPKNLQSFMSDSL